MVFVQGLAAAAGARMGDSGVLAAIASSQSDGITPYKRLRGKSFTIPMLGFGEFSLYKLQKKQFENWMNLLKFFLDIVTYCRNPVSAVHS